MDPFNFNNNIVYRGIINNPQRYSSYRWVRPPPLFQPYNIHGCMPLNRPPYMHNYAGHRAHNQYNGNTWHRTEQSNFRHTRTRYYSPYYIKKRQESTSQRSHQTASSKNDHLKSQEKYSQNKASTKACKITHTPVTIEKSGLSLKSCDHGSKASSETIPLSSQDTNPDDVVLEYKIHDKNRLSVENTDQSKSPKSLSFHQSESSESKKCDQSKATKSVSLNQSDSSQSKSPDQSKSLESKSLDQRQSLESKSPDQRQSLESKSPDQSKSLESKSPGQSEASELQSLDHNESSLSPKADIRELLESQTLDLKILSKSQKEPVSDSFKSRVPNLHSTSGSLNPPHIEAANSKIEPRIITAKLHQNTRANSSVEVRNDKEVFAKECSKDKLVTSCFNKFTTGKQICSERTPLRAIDVSNLDYSGESGHNRSCKSVVLGEATESFNLVKFERRKSGFDDKVQMMAKNKVSVYIDDDNVRVFSVKERPIHANEIAGSGNEDDDISIIDCYLPSAFEKKVALGHEHKEGDGVDDDDLEIVKVETGGKLSYEEFDFNIDNCKQEPATPEKKDVFTKCKPGSQPSVNSSCKQIEISVSQNVHDSSVILLSDSDDDDRVKDSKSGFRPEFSKNKAGETSDNAHIIIDDDSDETDANCSKTTVKMKEGKSDEGNIVKKPMGGPSDTVECKTAAIENKDGNGDGHQETVNKPQGNSSGNAKTLNHSGSLDEALKKLGFSQKDKIIVPGRTSVDIQGVTKETVKVYDSLKSAIVNPAICQSNTVDEISVQPQVTQTVILKSSEGNETLGSIYLSPVARNEINEPVATNIPSTESVQERGEGDINSQPNIAERLKTTDISEVKNDTKPILNDKEQVINECSKSDNKQLDNSGSKSVNIELLREIDTKDESIQAKSFSVQAINAEKADTVQELDNVSLLDETPTLENDETEFPKTSDIGIVEKRVDQHLSHLEESIGANIDPGIEDIMDIDDPDKLAETNEKDDKKENVKSVMTLMDTRDLSSDSESDCLDKDDLNEVEPVNKAIGNGYFLQDSFIENSQHSTMAVSDDSSDDDLFGVDSIFNAKKKLEKLSLRPAPSTPTKQLGSPAPSDTYISEEEEKEIQSENESKTSGQNETNNYDLDAFLEERKLKIEREKEMAQKINELKAAMTSGNMDGYDAQDEEDDQYTIEQSRNLELLKVEETAIKDKHPGEVIMTRSKYKHLFDQNLTPAQCGFKSGNTFLEEQVDKLPQEMLVEMIQTGIFQHCLHSFDNPHPFLEWVLHIMSIHRSVLVVQKCYELLHDSLKQEHGKCGSWTPGVKHFTRVFANFGCAPEKLCSKYDLNYLRFPNVTPAPANQVANDNHINRCTHYGFENLRFVIKILTFAVIKRGSHYRTKDLQRLMNIVSIVSLDTALCTGVLLTDIHFCMSALLNAVEEDHWSDVVKDLCHTIPKYASHHHNLVHLAEILPYTPRGIMVQRRLSLQILKKLLGLSTEYTTPQVKVGEIFEVVNNLKVKHSIDFYRIASYITLVDFSVGNETVKMSEKADLSSLIHRIHNLTSEVRECIAVLDRTMVKDMMVRLNSKWTFMLQNMGTKQTTLFNWAKPNTEDSSQEMVIETVGNTLDNELLSDGEM